MWLFPKVNVAKAQWKLRIACGLNLPWCGSIEWNMEEHVSMGWNMEWKIFGMEWKMEQKKIVTMEYGKIVFHSISYHVLAKISSFQTKLGHIVYLVFIGF